MGLVTIWKNDMRNVVGFIGTYVVDRYGMGIVDLQKESEVTESIFDS